LLSDLAQTLGHGIDGVLAAAQEGDEITDDQFRLCRERFTALVDLVEAITAYHRLRARN
jgi:CRISPR/Cas system CSM-associated protein Csm2 small subunit